MSAGFIPTQAREKTEKRLDRKRDMKDSTTYILRYNDSRGTTCEEIVSKFWCSPHRGLTYNVLRVLSLYKNVQAEVRDAFNPAEDITLILVGQPGLLPYKEATIKEALRMHPSIPSTLAKNHREAWKGHRWEGCAWWCNVFKLNFFAPRRDTDTSVDVQVGNPPVQHFIEPEKFIPARWLVDAPRKYGNDVKSALQSFSTGPKGRVRKRSAAHEVFLLCIEVVYTLTAGLAFLEMRSILTSML
ncbi:MAG: hypothetical protein Q9163_002234 [Psora crenata]